MISFKKKGGRYHPMKQGKQIEIRQAKEDHERSMCGRGSGDGGKDELYQSMIENEGIDQEGNMSQE